MRWTAVIRALPAIVLTWTMVSIPAMPPLHAHRAGVEGRSAAVVHAHAQRAARQASAGVSCGMVAAGEHGDHLRALFVDTAFEAASSGWVPAAAVAVECLLPEPQAARALDPDVVPVAHAPPLRGRVTRGPPSLS